MAKGLVDFSSLTPEQRLALVKVAGPYISPALNMISKVSVFLMKTGITLQEIEKAASNGVQTETEPGSVESGLLRVSDGPRLAPDRKWID